ncbi:hypothetical protein LWI28_019847 [Acer negundo]|uniref:Cucumisin n=1 Tax=Acer negundo TaxID=4023 RepID=A0AAD5NK66_ACENE|nr:hypothetical protein LWI28_019847 [Acer negundo]
MAKPKLPPPVLCLLFFVAFFAKCHSQEKKVHVVYMGEKLRGNINAESVHHSMLESILGSAEAAQESLVYSYGRSFNGFAAKLSDEEAAGFSGMEGVVSVLPNTILKLHTTRSWDFMGFNQSPVAGQHGGDVIIGMMDTEVVTDVKGATETHVLVVKGLVAEEEKTPAIIGARFYNSKNTYHDTDFKSPRDSEGHGTHTASIAAGREVAAASYYGLAEGLARGGSPNARIAVYKVCWPSDCFVADILAAVDDAIADGVDILSVSLGVYFPVEYFEDPIAIGSFHAMKHGILTSNSAGNEGPSRGWSSNYSPWLLTVAASSIDRKFVSQLLLGNGQIFTGVAINNFELIGTPLPLIWGGNAANYSANSIPLRSRFCHQGVLNSHKVKGKIILCEAFGDGSEIIRAGESVPNPIATILLGETWKDVLAPKVVSFSSRGPNVFSLDILKPDVTAPGVDILAAWSPIAHPLVYERDTRSVKYNIISGTSMSYPHASGVAAYLKAIHPSWSPAAIKSALMTTAYVMDPRKHDDKEFSYGSGYINPEKAVNPGLVFDASEADYIDFLCNMKSAKESLLYSYQRSFNGFVAKLSDEEVAEFSDMDGVVSIIPDMKLDLHTRSWDFMGFDQSYVGDSKGADIIIGLIDTGIWLESESFNGEGFGPPPAKWKGTCQTNNFTCNK